MKFSLFLPVICLTAPIVAEESIQNMPTSYFVESLHQEYRNGKFKSFLEDLHKDYETANHKWKYNDLLEQRKEKSQLLKQYEGEIAHDVKPDAMKKKSALLKESRNQEILKLCSDDSPLSQAMQANLVISFNEEEKKSLDFYSALKNKYKGDGETPLENQLISLDIEFWLKAFSLDLMLVNNQLDLDTFQKQQFVLELEKFSQMKWLCQEQMELSQHFEMIMKLTPKLQANLLLEQHLEQLGQGKILPQSDLDLQIKEVMVTYLEKRQKLLNEFFPK